MRIHDGIMLADDHKSIITYIHPIYFERMYKVIKICFILLLITISFGCISSNDQYYEKPTPIIIERITLNLCQTDPENADVWSTTKVNLFDKPSGFTIAGQLPACSSLVLEVLEKQTINGIEFYKIRYQNTVGWQTKRLLVGEE